MLEIKITLSSADADKLFDILERSGKDLTAEELAKELLASEIRRQHRAGKSGLA